MWPGIPIFEVVYAMQCIYRRVVLTILCASTFRYGTGYTHGWLSVGGNDWMGVACNPVTKAALIANIKASIDSVLAAAPAGFKLLLTGYGVPTVLISTCKLPDAVVLQEAIKAAVDQGEPSPAPNPTPPTCTCTTVCIACKRSAGHPLLTYASSPLRCKKPPSGGLVVHPSPVPWLYRMHTAAHSSYYTPIHCALHARALQARQGKSSSST